MKKKFLLLGLIYVQLSFAAPVTQFYKLIVYHYATVSQEQALDEFLAKQYIPLLHQKGFKQIGAFKPITNDTASKKQLILLVSSNQVNHLLDPIHWDLNEGSIYNAPIYNRYEQILLRAFKQMPQMKVPSDYSKKADRIYELRSYESPTEEKYLNKVHMFNEGGEIELFESLQFNAVFYADVLIGSRMPNLMYMTSFDNLESRNAHWKSFGESAVWKKLSSMPFYQNNMSALNSQLLKSTAYSDY